MNIEVTSLWLELNHTKINNDFEFLSFNSVTLQYIFHHFIVTAVSKLKNRVID